MLRGGGRPGADAVDPGLSGAALARLGDLWLVAGGAGLVLLEASAGDPAERHHRVDEAADQLRRALVDALTVAPFIEALVVVAGDAVPGPAEVPADLVRHLARPGPADPVLERARRFVDAGLLPPPWRRLRGSPVAG